MVAYGANGSGGTSGAARDDMDATGALDEDDEAEDEDKNREGAAGGEGGGDGGGNDLVVGPPEDLDCRTCGASSKG